MNKIKTMVSRETNYVYHMLAVAKCGYDNDYGRKYAGLHPFEDLQMLKDNEKLVTVKGGEYLGPLYPLFIVAAALDSPVPEFFAAIKHFVQTGDLELISDEVLEITANSVGNNPKGYWQGFYENCKEHDLPVVEICNVMISNYDIFCNQVWQESQLELLPYAQGIEQIFEENGFSHKAESVMGITLKNNFYATFCNSMQGGAEAIDISADRDVFGISRDFDKAEKFIAHEFVIYLLKQAFKDAGIGFSMEFWADIEGLAEFYLCQINGEVSGVFDEPNVQEAIKFYKAAYEADNSLTAAELFRKRAG
ncbi:MAG: hypothetical protein FWB74_03155 [Defluviitaleaceae bacterium]|nr:hypothetical protein [Defluviitaleaceae bacterium]